MRHPRDRVLARSEALTKDDIAQPSSTSGTTEHPQGHSALHENYEPVASTPTCGCRRSRRAITRACSLFLPLAHVFARFLRSSDPAATACSARALADLLLTTSHPFKPSYLLVVPRVLEKIYNSRRTRRRAARNEDLPVGSEGRDYCHRPSRCRRNRCWLADRLQIIRLRWAAARVYRVGRRNHLAHARFYAASASRPGTTASPRRSARSPSARPPVKIGTVGPALPPMSLQDRRRGRDHEEELASSSATCDPRRRPRASRRTAGSARATWEPGPRRLRVHHGPREEIIVTAGGRTSPRRPQHDALPPAHLQVLVVGDQGVRRHAITLDAEDTPIGSPPTRCPMSVAEAANVEGLLPGEKAVASANEALAPSRSVRSDLTDFTEANGLTPSEGQAPGSHAPASRPSSTRSTATRYLAPRDLRARERRPWPSPRSPLSISEPATASASSVYCEAGPPSEACAPAPRIAR